MKKTKKYEGFTIIEVVLVLAIAGLIFLMVFIAWPALQRSQHDTQRRNDMARFITQLDSYKTNNGGNVPAAGKTEPAVIQRAYVGFVDDYLKVGGDKFSDPGSGEDYQIGKAIACTSGGCGNFAEPSVGVIDVYTNARCESGKPVYDKGKNNVVIITKLEGSGHYCGQN